MTTYSKPIETPITMKEGLCNFVQMIINAAEEGDSREAMLRAVDLLQDLDSGVYDGALGISKDYARSHLNTQLAKAKADAAKFAAAEYARGVKDGALQKQAEIAKSLGLEK